MRIRYVLMLLIKEYRDEIQNTEDMKRPLSAVYAMRGYRRYVCVLAQCDDERGQRNSIASGSCNIFQVIIHTSHFAFKMIYYGSYSTHFNLKNQLNFGSFLLHFGFVLCSTCSPSYSFLLDLTVSFFFLLARVLRFTADMAHIPVQSRKYETINKF